MNRPLCMMVCLLLSACQPGGTDADGPEGGVSRLGDSVVARVDGTRIYRTDVERAAAAQGLISEGTQLSPDDPNFTRTRDELIDQRLLALDAVRRGLDGDDEARRRLRAARERILGNYLVERRLDEAVTEDAIRTLYTDQTELAARGPERRIRQIVVADEETALSVMERLDDEEDFAEIAAEASTDEETAGRGGRLGWVSRDMLPGVMRGPVFDTPVGQRAAPFDTPQGWRVIEVLEARTPNGRPYEDVREEIARFLTFRTVEDMMADLRDSAEIKYEDTQPEDTRPEDTLPDETKP